RSEQLIGRLLLIVRQGAVELGKGGLDRPGPLKPSDKPSLLHVETSRERWSLLLPGSRLRHHRSTHLAELFRVRAQRISEGVPGSCLSLGDLEFRTQESDTTLNPIDGGHAG